MGNPDSPEEFNYCFILRIFYSKINRKMPLSVKKWGVSFGAQ
jgi:hypothetical protein